jgi:hypothetical protein
MNTRKSKAGNKQMTGRNFDALPAAERERIFQELDNLSEADFKKWKPLSTRERKSHFQPPKNKGGRPKLGKGTRIISVSVEKDLLKHINAFAKARNMKRSELIVQSVREKIGA